MKVRTCLNLSDETRERLAKQAADAGRSMSAHIEALVAQYDAATKATKLANDEFRKEARNG
jgi:hypothetical protein